MMRNDIQEQRCFAVIGSSTAAMRAQSVLAGAAIRSEVVKADSEKSGRGCAYALSFSCLQEATIKSVLRDAGIRVRGVYRSDK